MNIYMFLCGGKLKKQHNNMTSYIKHIGLALILIGAIILVLSYFMGWVNNNAINVGSLVAMIVGLIVYIFGSKKNLERI